MVQRLSYKAGFFCFTLFALNGCQSVGHGKSFFIEKAMLDNAPVSSIAVNTATPSSSQDTPAARPPEMPELWHQLAHLDRPHLQQGLKTSQDSTARGWYALAYAVKNHEDPAELLDALQSWQREYPNHPASETIARADKLQQATPAHIALLLPVSGRFKGPGNAIRDGFMSAYYQDMPNHPSRVRVQVYDTNNADVKTLYAKAVSEGADFIVGPLKKEAVDDLLSLPHFSQPTLTLNYATQIVAAKPNVTQFGLSLDDEAEQVAIHAYQTQHQNAIVIAPEGAWGSKLVDTFTQNFTQLGGKVIGQLSYDNQTQLPEALKKLLQVDQSQARAKQLKTIIQSEINFSPRIRQDADMIFLIAYPSKARQIQPLLRFYYAGNIPVFALSLSYAGQQARHQNRDLEGMQFCDMPWMLEKTHPAVARLWPERFNRYQRLYALGVDSYQLTQRLPRLQQFPAFGTAGATGRLYLDPTARIKRGLPFARMHAGIAVIQQGSA